MVTSFPFVAPKINEYKGKGKGDKGKGKGMMFDKGKGRKYNGKGRRMLLLLSCRHELYCSNNFFIKCANNTFSDRCMM